MQTSVFDDISFVALVLELVLCYMMARTSRDGKLREMFLVTSFSMLVFGVYAIVAVLIIFNGGK